MAKWLSKRSLTAAGALLALFASLALATLQPMQDDELASISGKGVIDITKTEGQGTATTGSNNMDFVRITQGLTIDINANIRRVRLGEYGGDTCNDNLKCTADIDIEYMTLGTVDPSSGSFSTMTIVDPYIEFAIDTSQGDRRVAGFRLGARYQDGIMGGRNNVLSGNVAVTAFPQGGLAAFIADDLDVSNTGRRFTALEGTATAIGFIPIDVEAPLISSPKLNIEGIRNFWISVQDQNVQYPNQETAGANVVAEPGFWINLADNVTIRDMVSAGGTEFGNAFPNNCWNGNTTQSAADDAAHPFTAIHPNCR